VAKETVSPRMYSAILDIVEGRHDLLLCPCKLAETIQQPPLIQIDVPRDYMEPAPTWASFQTRPKNKKAFEVCRGWAAKYAAGKEYPAPLLCGPVGNGKTRLIWTILSDIVGRRSGRNHLLYNMEVAKARRQKDFDRRPPYTKFRYRYVTMPKFSESVRLRSRQLQDVVDYRNMLNSAEVLVIDDIGAENQTDLVREQLHLLIEDRVVNRKPIIIACNFSPSQLEKWTGVRILSRLTGACDIVEIHGTDMRVEEKSRRVKQL